MDMEQREKLRNIRMNRSEIVASYFTRIQQIRDELSIIGKVVEEGELVKVSLSSCTK